MSGAEDDLKKVTKMAYDQIRTYGMNKRIGHLSFLENQNMSGYKPYSKHLASIIDEVSNISSIFGEKKRQKLTS